MFAAAAQRLPPKLTLMTKTLFEGEFLGLSYSLQMA
jgi:hypothetical protein